MKMPWKSMERGDKEEKIQGRMYEIKKNPRGRGDKKAKIQRRAYEMIEIHRKFLGWLVN